MTRKGLAAIVIVCSLTACARAFPPSGGEQDRQPPRVLSTTPAARAVIQPTEDKVVFRFDETLSERGFSEALVTVSPLDGALRVERSSDEIKIGIDGGWRAGRVYRVVLLPGIRDRFTNERKDAIELVFSTGPTVQETAIAGIVTDRISGRAAQNAVIVATRRADSTVYMAVADTGGFYSLRNVPLGAYDMKAYMDANRNRRRDRSEAIDSGGVALLTLEADTLPVTFSILPVDTTGPRVTKAELMDSLHVRVTIDDWIDVNANLATAGASITLPDSSRFAGGIVMTLVVLERERAARAATAAAADSTGPERRTAPARGGRVNAPPSGATHEFIVRVERVLPPGTYTVNVADLSNIQGLVGGGSAKFEVRAPAAPRPPVRTDTIAVRPRY